MINGHGGNIYEMARRFGFLASDIIDMSSNVNPLGPPLGLIESIKKNIDSITVLPEVDSRQIICSFAEFYNIDPASVVAGNGTTSLIYSIPLALKTKKALILGPTYADYADSCIMYNVDYDYLMAQESNGFRHDIDMLRSRINRYDIVYICNPNNPTGALMSQDELEPVCRSFPDTCFIIDESYLPFTPDADKTSMIHSGLSNVIILNSMSKVFRVPGLRIGFVVASDKIIKKIGRFSLPWSVNSLAQAAVLYLMNNREHIKAFVDNTVEFIEAEKEKFLEIFENIPEIDFFKGAASFLLARLNGKFTSDMVCEELAKERILIRNCANFKGLSDRHIRISLKTGEINRMAAERLVNVLRVRSGKLRLRK